MNTLVIALVAVAVWLSSNIAFLVWFVARAMRHDWSALKQAKLQVVERDRTIETVRTENEALTSTVSALSGKLAIAISHPSQRGLTVAGSDGAKVYTFPVPEAIAHLDWEA